MTESNNVTALPTEAVEKAKALREETIKPKFQVNPIMSDDLFTLMELADSLDITDKIAEAYKSGIDRSAQRQLEANKRYGASLVSDHKLSEKEEAEKLAAEQAEGIATAAEDEKKGVDFIAIIMAAVMKNIRTIKQPMNELLNNILAEDRKVEDLNAVEYLQLIKQVVGSEDLQAFFRSIVS